MKNIFNTLDDCTPRWYKLSLGSLFGIFFVAFFSPPPFQIDINVIYAIAELGFFSLAGMIPYFLVKGGSVTVTKGDTSITVDSDGDDINNNINNTEE